MSFKALSLQRLQGNHAGNHQETSSFLVGKPAREPRGYNRKAELDRIHRELEAAGPWPESLHQWLEMANHDLLQRIRAANRAIDNAFQDESEDMGAILTKYRDSHLTALAAYREQQTQQTLF